MKIIIPLNILLKQVGSAGIDFIIRNVDQYKDNILSNFKEKYPEKYESFRHMPHEELFQHLSILKPLVQSLEQLRTLERPYDVTLELQTEEYEAFLFFKS